MPHEIVDYLSYKDELRFWSKVDLLSLDGCWRWLRYCDPKGYGRFGIAPSKFEMAHITAYKIFHPEYKTQKWVKSLDHKCGTHPCVNPYDLEDVTHVENIMRGNGWGAVNARKTHCNDGHEFTLENTRWEGNSRRCVTCYQRRNRSRGKTHRA